MRSLEPVRAEGCLVVLQHCRAPDAGILLSQPGPGHTGPLQTAVAWMLFAFTFWLTFLFSNPVHLQPMCWCHQRGPAGWPLSWAPFSFCLYSRQTCLCSSSECSLLCYEGPGDDGKSLARAWPHCCSMVGILSYTSP